MVCYGVDLGDRDRFFSAQRWQHSWKARCKHGLPAARRSEQKEVVAARGSDLQGSFRGGLAAHVPKIRDLPGSVWVEKGGLRFWQQVRPDEVLNGICQVGHTSYRRILQGSVFSGIFEGQEQLVAAHLAGERSESEGSSNGPDGAVESELSTNQAILEHLLRQMLVSGEQS